MENSMKSGSIFSEDMPLFYKSRERHEYKMITSVANAKVKQVVQWQSKPGERRKAGIFTAEGFKMFEEAPENSIREVYLSEEACERAREKETLWKKLQRTGYELVSSGVFAKMSDTRTPQGILTVAAQPKYELEQLLQGERPLLLVLENLQDPGNLGTIIRTGEGAGITGVIMSSSTVDIFNPKVIRSTMGSVYRVPFVIAENLTETIAKMKEKGIRTYAAHLKGEVYYDSFSFLEPTAFLIGNEGNGLTKELADRADFYLKIPMEGKVESLNAAVAASLLMYEGHRQRSMGR